MEDKGIRIFLSVLLVLLALILYKWESSPLQGSEETKEVAQQVSEPLLKEEKDSDTLIFSLESILGVSNYDVRLIQIDSNFLGGDYCPFFQRSRNCLRHSGRTFAQNNW